MAADIDFDELDKAVNSLMGNVNGKEDTPKPKTLNLNSTLKPDEKPKYDKLSEAASQIGNEALEPEVKKTIVEDLDAQIAAVEPTMADKIAAPASSQPAAGPAPQASQPQEATQPVAPQAAAPARTAPSGRFMDVVHPSSDMRTPPAPPLAVPARGGAQPAPTTPLTARQPEPNQAKPATPVADSELPLTPFLPDANTKVEKRPLGSAAPTEPEKPAVEAPATEDNTDDKKVDETVPINSDFAKTTDKVDEKEEKGQNQRPLDPTKFQASDSPESKDIQAIESMEVEGADPDEESVRAVESGDTGLLRNGGNNANGAIYDTNNHQPLNHPVKHKSGWGKVLVIILIIAVCVGLAAAAYFILGLGV